MGAALSALLLKLEGIFTLKEEDKNGLKSFSRSTTWFLLETGFGKSYVKQSSAERLAPGQ